VIDESFHLTPLDVRRTEFPGALRGYDKARVDEFRDRVANELERLTRLNQDLESKAKGFHEQLRAFRERDKALNEALVSAQQLRAETKDQAEREAQLVLREARGEGERLIDAAKAEVRRLGADIEGLERARRAYLAQFRELVSRQLADLDAIPATSAAATPSVTSPNGAEAAKEKPAAERPAPVAATSNAPLPPPPVPAPAHTPLPPSMASADEKEQGDSKGQEPRVPEPTTGGNRASVSTPAWLNVVPKNE
jgi:DivIVA domain-containing protein